MKKIKIGIQVEESIYKDLDNVSFLTKKSKTSIVNNALREYLKNVIKSENLQEKIDSLNT